MKTFICFSAALMIFSTSLLCLGEGWERDPFEFGDKKSKGEETKAKSLFDSLTLIIINEQLKIAIIGGHKYKTGNVVEGSMITEITIDSVITKSNEGAKTYYLDGRQGG